MNQLIELYSFLNFHKSYIDKIIKLDDSKFINNEDLIDSSLAIYNELISKLVGLNDVILTYKDLNNHVREILNVNSLMINQNRMVNSYLLLDFYKDKYNKLLILINEIVK